MVEHLRSIRLAERSRYVSTARSSKLIERLEEFAEHAQDCLDGGGTRRRIFCVIGDSGSGKSTSLQHAFKMVKAFQPRRNDRNELQSSIISLELRSTSSTKDLGHDLLAELGFSPSRRANEHELFKSLAKQLPERGVLFIHLDEAQSLLTSGTPTAVRALQEKLKSLVSDSKWPVHLILSGVPELANLMTGDRQLANRSHVMRFENLAFPADERIVKAMLADIAITHCDMSLDPTLLTDDFLGRLLRATSGALGQMIETIREACFSALNSGRTTLSPRDFVKLYGRNSGSRRRENIMEVADWNSLTPENALIDLATSGEAEPKRRRKAK